MGKKSSRKRAAVASRRPEREVPETAAVPSADASRPQPSLAKRLTFHALTVVLFFALVEIVLAAAGIRPVVVEEDPYVGFASRLRLFVPAAGGEILRTARNKLALFNDQSFPRRKPRGTRRVFTLGGSCTYGRPFDDATSWSGWLREYLAELDGEHRWEVVNAGGISYASYRVAALMEELVDYDPDLFLIYSGHNEFLERRTYGELIAEPEVLTRTKLLLQRSRLWALGRRAVERRERRARERYQLTGEVEELLESSAGLDYYFRDEDFERQVLDHYRFNLERMVALARAAGAEPMLVTIPVNEKDFSPFKSQHTDGLGEAERERHAELRAAAAAALQASEGARALELARRAVEIDPLYAEGHFLEGRALSLLGRHREAGEAYARAIAEDVCPLRALERSNEIIAETAARQGVELVDFRRRLKDWMEAEHGHRNLGDEAFLDHAHTTVEGNGLLARALVERLGESGRLELAADWRERAAGVEREVLARVDDEALARAYKNLSKLLIWAGKKREAERYVRLAETALESDWEVRYNAGVVAAEAGQLENAIVAFRQAVRLEPRSASAHDRLAVALAEAGRLEEAIAAGERAAELDPQTASYWNNLGTLYSVAGNPRRALEVTRRAVSRRPDFAEAHNNLGKIHFDLGEHDAALVAFARAVELRPRYAEAMTNRGLVLGELGRYAEAVAAFDQALEAEPRLASAALGKGRALLAAGESDRAAEALEQAIVADPEAVEAYELLIAAGSAPRALELLERGLAARPRAASLHHLHGRFLAQAGQLDPAAAAFASAVELAPGLLAARIDLGRVRMAQSRPGEAIELYRDALEGREDDPRLHHVLASALLVAGRHDEARVHLERALELDPQNAVAAHDLAALHERGGRRDEALELYRRAARLEPGLAAARAGVERLGGGVGGR